MKILISVDNSPLSEKVVTFASHLINKMHDEKIEVAFLYVIDSSLSTDAGPSYYETLLKELREEGEKLLHMAQKNLNKLDIYFFPEGKPFDLIMKTISEWDAELLIIGTHGKKGIEHLLMGSVAEKLVRHSNIPVLVVPVAYKAK